MRRLLLAIALLGLLAPPAWAQEWRWSKKDKKQLQALLGQVEQGPEGLPHRLDAEHWVVETAVTPEFTAELGLFMDRFFEAFALLMRELEATPLIARKPTVQVYASAEDYRRHHTSGSRGYYVYKWDGSGNWTHLHLYTFVQQPAEREFRSFYHPILLHEGTHVLMRRLLGKAQLMKWFDEGVASWFQFYDLRQSVKANRKGRYRRSFYRPHLARVLAAGPPRLADLLKLGPLNFNPDGMGPIAHGNYAQAESFIDLLLSSGKGAKVFKAVFWKLREAKFPLLSDDEIRGLEPGWWKHAGRVAK